MSVLVTGGAGYIGSHATLALLDAGYDVVVIDNLSTGVREAVPASVPLVIGDVGDGDLTAKIMREHKVDAIMHFAGSIIVPESVSDPLKYYLNNTANSRTLIQSAVKNNVGTFIFSSTAAVYGMPEIIPVTEDAPTVPINPYGTSKLMTEWMLRDTTAAHDLVAGVLRYFNVAGADPQGRVGQSTPRATHLIKVACQTAIGAREKVQIFGDDYPTEDGTGIRDYIHVCDLVDAHVELLKYLTSKRQSVTMNCGYGRGYSVRQVLDTVQRVSGDKLNIETASRRAGDPPIIVADASRIGETLGWRPKHDDLDFIVRTALDWEKRLHRIA
ncbi:MAG TPA: UDP-glucose 4-epimerase GalE [Alphaproteobacteria bacterium]|nr:UDP-glucose 4-epimerase GalE [Alphaproteobacteria bacterium]